jgi:hypothetical protein
MARQITCVCGRSFHIGDGPAGVQCRGCGRWWSGRGLSPVGAVVTVLSGGETARTRRKAGTCRPSRARSHRGRQTDRRRPPRKPVGSVLRYLFG